MTNFNNYKRWQAMAARSPNINVRNCRFIDNAGRNIDNEYGQHTETISPTVTGAVWGLR
jgi:hypothetical protein